MELALKRELLLRLGHFDVLGLGKLNLFFPFSCSEFGVSEDFSDSTKTVPSRTPHWKSQQDEGRSFKWRWNYGEPAFKSLTT